LTPVVDRATDRCHALLARSARWFSWIFNLQYLYREALYEDESFSERELAALLASKVFYQLQEYDESMRFALGAGKLFNLDKPGEFENTIISTFTLRCVQTER
jgi:hypothetical protein